MPPTDVIVIGAGAAGLAATEALGSLEKTVTCIEAGPRIGGRAFTDTETFGIPFDRGAHWLHNGAINAFIDKGKALGLDVYPAPNHAVTAGDDPDGTALWAEVDAISDAMRREAEAGNDVALSNLFRPLTDWSFSAAMMHILPMGRNLHEISTKDFADYQESPDWFCRQGYGTLVAMNAADVPVTLNTRASRVTTTADGVEVETNNGTLAAKAVIVTVSQGILAAGDIRFDPPLETDRLDAIDAINLGAYNHAVLQFPPEALPVEPDTWVTYRITPSDDGIHRGGGALCNISGTGLCAFENAGDFATELENAGPEAAIDYALSRLTEIFGNDLKSSFIKGAATAWGRDPLFKGSYSGAMPGQAHKRPVLRQPHAERVFFAGEATHHVEPGTVSGAHKEGLRAAEEVAALLG
ncbi:flavin monoamine oxidase family protein [Roseovarius indicus]|uniref:flavin monoamine oxidase family protein n=1 Tax=Roseovarius indicus TaxID=540747 RepID=UPI0032EB959F